MKCKVKGCTETARTTQQGKCWKVNGMCPRHTVIFSPQFYSKKYNEAKMPFRKRTRIKMRIAV